MKQQLLGYEGDMYRLDHSEHIAGRLDRVAPQILCSMRNLMAWSPEQIRPYLRRAGFEYVAYMVEFEHDWPLASALIERWRLESHTFHLPCGEMTITLQDVAYQLGLRIDGDPHHLGRTIKEFCEQLLGVVPGPDDRQSHTKWTVKLTWFQNTDATEERLMRYTRGYIMQLIGGMLFPDASDSQMCRAMEHGQCNLGGCVSLLLSWAYHHLPLIRPDGFETRRFLLVERWVQYRPDNDRGETSLRHYRCTLNGIGMLNVEWTPYADPQLIGLVPPAIAKAELSLTVVCPLLCFAIVEWHQVYRAVRQFGVTKA
ncbi:hypothetical protein Ahy_B04g071538 [Arachis hypogaea]|uniref:Aminotransferase-like plant mobile domain-containing protein n=1 Tax=Arachis hypogaea TaxID=3818 RepID=A0A444ZKZ0_ARAHY|nr:hypothetical protein Ahy_B04g071538 [Arachis hypogaea]